MVVCMHNASGKRDYNIIMCSLVPRPSTPPAFDRNPNPLHFCILEAIKSWRCGRPGNEARKMFGPVRIIPYEQYYY